MLTKVTKKKTASVRIIAGKWRRRRVYFPDVPGLRPTQDHVRETLFNWLQHSLQETRCLDLFAGSGVLGLEALSRGAASVTFVDAHRDVVNTINENARHLSVNNYEVYHATIPGFATPPFTSVYDVVFLDPPFGQDLLLPSLNWLVAQHLINQETVIYFETDHAGRHCLEQLDCDIVCEKKTQSIVYGLLHLNSTDIK